MSDKQILEQQIKAQGELVRKYKAAKECKEKVSTRCIIQKNHHIYYEFVYAILLFMVSYQVY